MWWHSGCARQLSTSDERRTNQFISRAHSQPPLGGRQRASEGGRLPRRGWGYARGGGWVDVGVAVW